MIYSLNSKVLQSRYWPLFILFNAVKIWHASVKTGQKSATEAKQIKKLINSLCSTQLQTQQKPPQQGKHTGLCTFICNPKQPSFRIFAASNVSYRKYEKNCAKLLYFAAFFLIREISQVNLWEMVKTPIRR